MKVKKSTLLLAAALLLISILPFIGIEHGSRGEDSEYRIYFIKQEPTFKLFFRNNIGCDLCESWSSYDDMLPSQQQDLIMLCKYRYGITDHTTCFYEQKNRKRI